MAWVGLGGTFDPVHCGHVAVAHAVARRLGMRVHLVPAHVPPHKRTGPSDAVHRLRMLELAVAGDRALAVDPRELGRDGPSYTVDTLAELRREVGGDAPIVWVIGADSLASLHRWHRWEALFEHAHVLAVGRPGHALDAQGSDAEAAAFLAARLRPVTGLLATAAGHLALLRMEPPRTESSTAIRAAVAAGRTIAGLVPPAVAAYIHRHQLYAGPRAA